MLLTTKCSADSVDLPLVVALMCRLIILSKLFSRNDFMLIGLESYAVVWVAFPALGGAGCILATSRGCPALP